VSAHSRRRFVKMEQGKRRRGDVVLLANLKGGGRPGASVRLLLGVGGRYTMAHGATARTEGAAVAWVS
jgi:hypothetical protein